MSLSPFAFAGSSLIENGYSAIPLVPGDKIPGMLAGSDWKFRRGWTKFCSVAPTAFEVRLWASWPSAGLGVACGRGLVAVDIDRDDLVDPVLAALPEALVAKRGQKGLTVFYRANTDKVRSRSFRIDGMTALDLISFGKQTVLPPSIHPVTGAPYSWTTQRTLGDTPLAHLPEVPDDLAERLAEALKPFGYEDEKKFDIGSEPAHIESHSHSQSNEFFRRLNEDALANLDAWVPRLGLQRIARHGTGWRAVPEWRPSNSGKPVGRRGMNVSFDHKGIVDFGDGGKTYTAINTVMAAHDLSDWQMEQAAVWLGEKLGYDFSQKIVLLPRPSAETVDEPAPEEESDAPKPEPEPFDPKDERIKELHDLTYVPGLVGELVNWIEASSLNPNRILALGAALTLVGALAGRHYASPTDLRTNFYAIGLAPSGFGKDHARDCIKNLLTQAGLLRFLGGSKIMSGSAMRARVETQPSILWMIDEFGGFVRSVNDKRSPHTFQIRDHILEYFTSAASVFQGADYAGSQGVPCHNPNVCLYGTTTPADFWGAMGSLAVADGFLARFVAFQVDGRLPDDVKPTQSKSNPPETIVNACRALLMPREGAGNLTGRTSDGSTKVDPYIVGWGEGAEQEWDLLRKRYREIGHSAAVELQPLWNRAAEHAQKIALICAIGENPIIPEITAQNLKTAAGIINICIAGTIEEISGRLADNDRQREYLDIKRLIVEAGRSGISRTALSRRVNGRVDRRRLDDILETLTLHTKEIASQIVQNPNGGPKGARYIASRYLRH